jgi:hypothetical protein
VISPGGFLINSLPEAIRAEPVTFVLDWTLATAR